MLIDYIAHAIVGDAGAEFLLEGQGRRVGDTATTQEKVAFMVASYLSPSHSARHRVHAIRAQPLSV